MIRIPLRVSGVDLDDDVVLDLLGQHLSDVTWSEFGGVVLATLHATATNPVASAVEVARRISHVLPGAEVLDVDLELVSVSDIASRLGVSREAVRLWAEGRRGPGNFPLPMGTVGGGKSKVWPWARVHRWVRENYEIGDGSDYLTPEQVAELNASLLRIKNPIDNEWETVSSFQRRVSAPGDDAEDFRDLLARLKEEFLSVAAKNHMVLALLMAEDGSVWTARYGFPYPSGYLEVSSESVHVEGPA